MKNRIVFFFVAFLGLSLFGEQNRWLVGEPVLLPGPAGSFDEVSVKDPSLVFFDGKWHLFYTARSNDEYTTGYVSARRLDELQAAPRHELKMIRGEQRYGCAPQVFYFTPQRMWYLVFQNRDSNYQPVYSTSGNISDPKSWSAPKALITKDNKAKWIDFWVLCYEGRAYLFYTEDHSGVVVRSAGLEDFPQGWGEPKTVYSDIHEAVHIYKVRDKTEFHMVYELNKGGLRSFGLAMAPHPEGPWRKVTDEYATGDQLECGGGGAWTEMVSHGEALRSGYDEKMEYDAENCRWLIQGIMKKDKDGAYPSLPWKLGVIGLKNSNAER